MTVRLICYAEDCGEEEQKVLINESQEGVAHRPVPHPFFAPSNEQPEAANLSARLIDLRSTDRRF